MFANIYQGLIVTSKTLMNISFIYIKEMMFLN